LLVGVIESARWDHPPMGL